MLKNIIFDVGDVLLGYRWQEMLMDYGLSMEEAQRVGNEVFEEEIWWKELDGGWISMEEAIQKYHILFPKDKESIIYFLEKAELMVVPRPEIWKKLEILKAKGYHIYILSNYSKELFEKHTKDALFLDIIDGGIVSYQVHMIKPEERIYRALLEKYDLNAEECLFLDDRLVNVEGARKVGIQAVQVISEEMLNDFLENMCQS